jgi:hypothetical protein
LHRQFKAKDNSCLRASTVEGKLSFDTLTGAAYRFIQVVDGSAPGQAAQTGVVTPMAFAIGHGAMKIFAAPRRALSAVKKFFSFATMAALYGLILRSVGPGPNMAALTSLTNRRGHSQLGRWKRQA